jgi:hypothetical protein
MTAVVNGWLQEAGHIDTQAAAPFASPLNLRRP